MCLNVNDGHWTVQDTYRFPNKKLMSMMGSTYNKYKNIQAAR